MFTTRATGLRTRVPHGAGRNICQGYAHEVIQAGLSSAMHILHIPQVGSKDPRHYIVLLVTRSCTLMRPHVRHTWLLIAMPTHTQGTPNIRVKPDFTMQLQILRLTRAQYCCLHGMHRSITVTSSETPAPSITQCVLACILNTTYRNAACTHCCSAHGPKGTRYMLNLRRLNAGCQHIPKAKKTYTSSLVCAVSGNSASPFSRSDLVQLLSNTRARLAHFTTADACATLHSSLQS